MTPPDSSDGSPTLDFDGQLDAARGWFERSVDGTLGVEEEFAICDPDSLDLVPRFDEVEAAARAAGLDDAVAGELLASEVEFRTGRCETWADAVAEVTAIRTAIADVARSVGVVLGASATHPWADYREQAKIDSPYYRTLVERMQYVAHRNNTFGLHVHVGVRGADRAIRVHDALRSITPLLLALSASSPFLDGRDSGLASGRSLTFSRTFPRGNVAPAFGSFQGYVDHVRWLRDAGSIESVGQMWWATRPHLLHGTVELRCFDGQPDVRDTLALAALAEATVLHLADLDDAGELPPPVESHLIDENCWRAARAGTDAVFIALPGSGHVCADEAIGRLVADARAAGARHDLDVDAGLDRIEELLASGCSAIRQRASFEQSGDLRATYRDVVDATMSSATLVSERSS